MKKIDENVATHTSPGNGMMKVSLLLLNFFQQTNTIEDVLIEGCREFDGLSESLFTLSKRTIYSDNIWKIPSLVIFGHGDIITFLKMYFYSNGMLRISTATIFSMGIYTVFRLRNSGPQGPYDIPLANA